MVGSKLNLKMLRDLKFSPMMFAGIVMLIMVGITLFVASYESYINLGGSYEMSYEKLDLADFYVPVQSAPLDVVDRIERIPGVREVEGRRIEEVEIEQPRLATRKLVGRVISIPDIGTPKVNRLKVISGSFPIRETSREVLLEASFAKYHNYSAGDTLRVVIDEEKVTFRIAGVVQSPEYIYVVRSREDPMPNPREFGVMWMRRAMVDKLFGTSGSVNEVNVRMARGANRHSAMTTAGRILHPYSAEDPIPKELHPCVELLRMDLMGFRQLAIFFPVLFLIISSLTIYNLLGRMVRAQRSQIGFLRAIGVSRYAIAVHYLSFAVLMGAIGTLAGSVCGHYLSLWITRMYTNFVQVPYFDTSPSWGVLGVGFCASTAVALFAGLSPSISAANLPPAQAIRPDIPPSGRTAVFEKRIPWLGRLSLLSRLPLRNAVRNPRRTISNVAGIACGVILIVVSAGLIDSSVAAIDFYLKQTLNYDVMVSYLHPQREFISERLSDWTGVQAVEPLLMMPAKVVKGDVTQNILIYGIRPGDNLISLYDTDGSMAHLQRQGLMVADSTARKLGLGEGATLQLRLPERTIPDIPALGSYQDISPLAQLQVQLAQPSYRESVLSSSRAALEINMDRRVRVSRVLYQPVGNSAAANIDEVRRWYGTAIELPPKAITSVAIKVDPEYEPEVVRKLYHTDEVASVIVTSDMREEVDRMMESSRTFFNVMLAFSIALAAVIVFSSTIMNVIERTRETATLRTIGVSTGRIGRMIAVENLLAYVVGIVIGIPAGRLLADLFVQSYESETFHMQTTIFPVTYVLAVAGLLLTVLLAQIPGMRYVKKTELAKATKDIG